MNRPTSYRDFNQALIEDFRANAGKIPSGPFANAPLLLLTTVGAKSGTERTMPLAYTRDGDRYVIVASKGGAPTHPGWYLNLQKDPDVELQVLDEVFPARARTADAEERERLWELVNRQWPDYAGYQTKTDREIPVVVLERAAR